MANAKYCPKCGTPVKPTDKYCGKCGNHLQQLKPKPAPKPRKPMSKKSKIMLFGGLAVLLVLFGLYNIGKSRFSRENQVSAIITALKNPSEDLTPYVKIDDTRAVVNKDTLKSIQKYYEKRRQEANNLDSETNLNLIASGRKWLIYPKYVLKLDTYSPKVLSNHANSEIYLDGKKVGTVVKDGESYSQTLSHVIPGQHELMVKFKANGKNLTTERTVNIWSNESINLGIETISFTVQSVPNGTVYLNNKPVGKLNSDGIKVFKDYPTNTELNLYVASSFNKQRIRSQRVENLTSTIRNDEYSHYISNFDDLGSEEASTTVYEKDDQIFVTPIWKGMITEDEASDLLEASFGGPSSDDFVNGSSNKDYQALKKQADALDDDDNLDDFLVEVKIKRIRPAGDNYSSVDYAIVFHYEYGDNEKTVTHNYQNAIFYYEDDEQKLQLFGKE
ncbi:TcaA 3rd/4th domain-containing protein [Lactobacillus gigeriorum]|nr:zinc-ribbon domain-containing protein [Lactobacillus gigeriorum]CCI87518.1 Putative uncharacterized protein [Lactobacillus gigeriorum DSM 23908 = CRBIP 24.85]